jgi:hypothetical protein
MQTPRGRETGRPRAILILRRYGSIAAMNAGHAAECFVCRKHADRGSLLPGGFVAEDDLVVVSHVVTP